MGTSGNIEGKDKPKGRLTALQFLMSKLNAAEFETEFDEITESYRSIAFIMNEWIEYNKKIDKQ